MPLSISGITTVQGVSAGGAVGTKPKRAIFLRLPDEIVGALIERRGNKPNDPPLDIDFGEHPGIHIGGSFFSTEFANSSRFHEIFTQVSNKSQAPLKHFASVEGNILVKRELDAKISGQVKSRTVASQRQAKARPIQMIDTPPAANKKATSKPTKKSKANGKATLPKPESTPSNKNNAIASARNVSPLPPPVGKTNPITSEAQSLMRYRLIHLLALTPSTSADAIRTIGGENHSNINTRSTISTLLSQVALEDMPPKRSDPNPPPRLWRLKAESWLETRPHEYPNLNDEERKRMALQARQALTSMKIPPTDPRWEHVKYKSVSGAASVPATTPSTSRSSTIGGPKPSKLSSETKPSPPPAAAGRRSLPGSQNIVRTAKTATPPSSNLTPTLSSKELPSTSSSTKTKTARTGDSATSSQAALSRPAVDHAKRKRDRDYEIEEELIKTSETKRRRPSDEEPAIDPSPRSKTVSKSTSSHRASTSTPTVSKAVNRSVTPSSLSKSHKPNGSSSSKRRRSPIYTSSSDEDSQDVPAPSKLHAAFSAKRGASPRNVNGHRKALPYIIPRINFGGTLPKDHASLRKRYNALYPSYIAVYQKCVEQRMAIERLLEDTPPAEEGEVEEELVGTSDVEMMDASDLERLNTDFLKLENELSRINTALQSAVS